MALILSGSYNVSGNWRVSTANFDFTFTNAGQTGPTGPSLAQAKTAYASNGQFNENDTAVFNVTSGYQTFVVPTTGTYRFTVNGASGGVWTTNPADATTAALMPTIGGYVRMPGATVVGDYALTAGQAITMVIGQGGGDDTNTVANCPGGGGGTFVTLGVYTAVTSAIDTLLFAAGGGGGCGYQSADAPVTGTAPFNISKGQGGVAGGTAGAAGGTNGAGSASGATTGNSGGGAGYLSGCPTSATANFGGATSTTIAYGFRQGAIGCDQVGGAARGYGGFGGGGTGANSTISDDDKGGGGGYSGGGYAFDANLSAGGGGSYAIASATNVTITGGGNTTGRHGSVRIQLL